MFKLNIDSSSIEVDSKVSISHDEDGRVNVPEGYAYCSDCEALTPRDKPRRSWGLIGDCRVCGSSIFTDQHCPNCAWETPDEYLPIVCEEIIHGEGCHCRDYFDFKVDDDVYMVGHNCSWDKHIIAEFCRENKINSYEVFLTLKAQGLETCGCERVTVFRNLEFFNHWETPYASMDCYNAVDFGCSIRCPICGCVFSISDGNC